MDIRESNLKVSQDEFTESKFLHLQNEFRQQLPNTLFAIDQLWKKIVNNTNNADDAKKISHLLLHLADTCGTYGADEVSYIARKCYQTFKPFEGQDFPASVNTTTTENLDNELKQLNIESHEWLSTDTPIFLKTKDKVNRTEKTVYSLMYDNDLLLELTREAEKQNCNIVHFDSLDKIKTACGSKNPTSVIIDSDFVDGNISGTNAVEQLKKHVKDCPPIIFFSDKKDADYRLKTVRAGVDRYFCKPLKVNKVIQTLKSFNLELDNVPYRVLVIDNDLPLLECYSTVLTESGMVVLSESNPFNGFNSIEKFLPDIIVLDMYMPDCSGKELVNMIRQDDRWALTPIIFLSGEQDIHNQLEAIDQGADDFLVKPINTSKLVAVVSASAKRARKNIKLNRELKATLRENESQLIALDQHAIVSVADVYGRIIHVNDKLCEISGYSRDELLDQNHNILKSGYHDKQFYKNLWDTISSGEIWHGVICNKTKTEDEYWVDSTIVPFLDDNGKPYKYVSVRTDVTMLRVSEERLSRSQEFANIGTWDWNIVSGELFWSERILPLFGYDKEKIEPTYERFIAAVHPDDRELVTTAIHDCSENGIGYDIEHRIVWPDGSVHWVHENGNMVRNNHGAPVHMLGVVRDITDFKTTEQKMILAREEAERANLEKSKFLSSMSHELRTPMNSIVGFSQLLQMSKTQPLTELQENNVSEIMVAGNHLMNLIDDVLDLSKIEAGHLELSPSNVDINSIVKESLQLITPLAQSRDVEIAIVCNDKMIDTTQLEKENYFAHTDKTRFKQIILNLLSNAAKYNREGGKITLAYKEIEDGLLRVNITDTGDGLSFEQQEQLFTAFNRLGIEKTEVEGSGIGLVITKKIVELMGGKIGVESKVGDGSTFWFELPIKPDDEIEINNDKTKSRSIDKNAIKQSKEKKSVLYVEDNPANLRLVEQILESIPYIKMWSAPEPLLGLELASKHIPDLILLDINLPGMDGYKVLEKLRQQESTKDIPVIAISANAMPKDIEKGKQAGFDGYITKPVNVKELLSEVQRKFENA